MCYEYDIDARGQCILGFKIRMTLRKDIVRMGYRKIMMKREKRETLYKYLKGVGDSEKGKCINTT